MPRHFFVFTLLIAVLRISDAAPAPRFVAPGSCATSLCHGGAGELRHQQPTWSRFDMHARAHATLTTARSEQIMRALGGGEAPRTAECTICHAPYQGVPTERVASPIDPAIGVSCQNCHGAAEHWLRSHTRPDYSHRDRVHAGMREMRPLYDRANACVACHQRVSEKLLQAGHPELIFELDGQTMGEPRHWIERRRYNGPQAWLVGQVVALREMVWKDGRQTAASNQFQQRLAALKWLLRPLAGLSESLPELGGEVESVDVFAKAVGRLDWNAELTRRCLDLCAGRAVDFRDTAIVKEEQARRAERLVLALDRLVAGLDGEAGGRLESAVKRLFKLAQSVPDFDPALFARELEGLANQH